MPFPKFKPSFFNEQIAAMGQRVYYIPVSRCYCWRASSGQATPDCSECGGTGYLYGTPVEYTILLHAVTDMEEYKNFGDVEVGDLVATIPAQAKSVDGDMVTCALYDEITSGDLIRMADVTRVDTQVVLRENGGNDVLAEKPVVALIKVNRVGVTYTIGTDCELENDGVKWLGVSEPTAGLHYHVTYKFYPSYRVFRNLGLERRFPGTVELPKRYQLKVADAMMSEVVP